MEVFELSYVGSPKGLMEYLGQQNCEHCWGSGIYNFFEQDRDGHWADTGSRTCECQLKEEE